MNTSFEKLKTWLTHSGLVISDKNHEDNGGVYSFYDQNKEEYSFLYPEITGYHISTMKFLYIHEQNENYKNIAISSSKWLKNLHEQHGGIIQNVTNDMSNHLVYSFDTAICAKGVFDCYHITKDNNLLEFGKKLIDWLINDAVNNNGTVKPYQNLSSNNFEESDSVWYKKPGCFHIKTVIPILQLYEITKEDNLLETATKICNSFKNYQNSDGSIRLHQNDNVINLHTMCYSLEGLIYAYRFTQEKKYLDCCEKAIIWSFNQINSDGSIELWYNSRYKSKASYPLAQLIRITLLLEKICDLDIEKEKIDKLKNFLLSLQAFHTKSEIDGGFYEEFYKSMLGWKKRYKINSWASMFALQALYWSENFGKWEFDTEIENLY